MKQTSQNHRRGGVQLRFVNKVSMCEVGDSPVRNSFLNIIDVNSLDQLHGYKEYINWLICLDTDISGARLCEHNVDSQ